MTVITDTAVRRRLSALHAAHAGKASLLAVARARLADLELKKSQLERRQAQEERQKLPTGEVDDSALTAALLDDPNAALEGEALTAAAKLVASASAARSAVKARVALIRSALLKSEPLVVDAGRRVAELEQEEKEALDELRQATYDALTDEFERQFKKLYDDVIEPMMAFREHASGTYLESESQITLRKWIPAADPTSRDELGRWETEHLLLDWPSHNERRRSRADDVRSDFLAGLAAKKG